MLKLIIILSVFILFFPSGEPENLTLGEPESLSLQEEDSEVEGVQGETAIVEILTIPKGAMIYIDGERFGISPVGGKAVLSGEHYLTVKKRGYLTYDKDIYIPPDESVLLILPVIQAPDGYSDSLRKAQSRAGVILDLEMGAFRQWLRTSERHADDLAHMADSCIRFANALKYMGLDLDALRCRNTACGFFILLELASGSSYFADEPNASQQSAAGCRHNAHANKAALLRLVKGFIDDLSSDEPYTRAYAAHALRYTYCSFDGTVKAHEALETAYKSEEDEFVQFVILEALEQIAFEPMGP
jgi:hypothetical protein